MLSDITQHVNKASVGHDIRMEHRGNKDEGFKREKKSTRNG